MSDASKFVPLNGADELQEVDEAEVVLAYIPVGKEHQPDNAEAELIVLDPLKVLNAKVDAVGTQEDGWRVTVNRVNAEEPIHNPGVHHLLVVIFVLREKKQVHCTVYRSVLDPSPSD